MPEPTTPPPSKRRPRTARPKSDPRRKPAPPTRRPGDAVYKDKGPRPAIQALGTDAPSRDRARADTTLYTAAELREKYPNDPKIQALTDEKVQALTQTSNYRDIVKGTRTGVFEHNLVADAYGYEDEQGGGQLTATDAARADEDAQASYDRFISSLDRLDQGNLEQADEFRYVAERAATLLALEPDENTTDEEREQIEQAKTAAALIFYDHNQELAPHIKLALGDTWWENNYTKINDLVRPVREAEGEQGFRFGIEGDDFGSVLHNIGVVAGKGAQLKGVSHFLSLLQASEQVAARTLAGGHAALQAATSDDDQGLGVSGALKYSGSQVLGTLPSLWQGLTKNTDDKNLVKLDDGSYASFDQDGDGYVNLREAVGRTDELSELGDDFANGLRILTGGAMEDGAASRLVGLFDTAGLAAIDPATWVTFGAGQKSKAALATLAQARGGSEAASISRMVVREIVGSGRALSTFSDTERLAVRATFKEAAAENLARRSARSTARLANNDSVILRTLRRESKDASTQLERSIANNVRLMEEAVERGGVPGIRIADNTLIKYKSLRNAIRVFTHQAERSPKWVQVFAKTHKIKKVDELLAFIHNFDETVPVPAAIRNDIKSWETMANAASTDPHEFLDDLLQVAPDPAQSFDEIEAFGRALLGDDVVAGWRPYFENQWHQELKPGSRAPVSKVGDPVSPELSIPGETGTSRVDRENAWYNEFAFQDSQSANLLEGDYETFWDRALKERELLDPDNTATFIEQDRKTDLLSRGGRDPSSRAGTYESKFRSLMRAQDKAIKNDLDAAYGKAAKEARKAARDEADEVASILRMFDESKPARKAVDLSDEAIPARVAANLEIYKQPGRWVDLELAGRNGPGHTVDEVAGNLTTRRLFPTMKEDFAKLRDAFGSRFSTFYRVRRDASLGEEVAQFMDNQAAEAAAVRRTSHDLAAMLDIDAKGRSKLEQRALAETEDYKRLLDRALSDADGPQVGIAALRKEGLEDTARLVEVVDAMRQHVAGFNDLSGVGNKFGLESGNKGYMPRTHHAAAQDYADQYFGKISKEVDDKFVEMGLAPKSATAAEMDVGGHAKVRQQGFLKARTYEETVNSVMEVNETARKEFKEMGLDGSDGFTLYEESPVSAMMMRFQAAQESRVYTSMLDGMTEFESPTGLKLGYSFTGDEVKSGKAGLMMESEYSEFGRRPYAKVEKPNGGAWYIDDEVLAEINETRRIVGSTQEMGKITEAMNTWNNVWAAWATVPKPAFHNRNMLGNVFMMVKEGFSSPRAFDEAFLLQRRMSKTIREMREAGSTFDEAVTKLAYDEPTSQLLRDVRTYDLADTNMVTDLLDDYNPLERSAGGILADNKVISVGRAVGNTVEGNARISMYIDGINKGMDPTQAARRARKTLIDYQDFTQFESNNLRMVSRFYSFARGNTALQAQVMFRSPGTIANINRLGREFQDTMLASFGWNRDPDSEHMVPSWANDMAHTYEKDGETIVSSIDTPWGAFSDTTEQLHSSLTIPYWLGQVVFNGDEESRDQTGNVIRNALQLLSGGPVQGVTVLSEMALGRDTFTGRDLNDVDRTVVDKINRLASVIAPVGSSIDKDLEASGLYEKLGVMQDEETNKDGERVHPDRVVGAARLMNTLAGFGVSQGYDPTEAEMNAVLWDLDKALDEAQDLIPREDRLTVRDLVDTGVIIRRNEAYMELFYSGVGPDEMTEEDRERMRDAGVPNAILESLGLDVPEGETKEYTEEHNAARIQRMFDTLAITNPELVIDQAMRDNIILYSSGMTIKDVEDLGIEAFHSTNNYKDGKTGEPTEAELDAQEKANEAYLRRVMGLVGRDYDEFVAANPLMTSFDRKVRQMKEAGWSDDKISEHLIDEMSKKRKVLLFGKDAVEDSFGYETYTDEEKASWERKAAEETSLLRFFFIKNMGREPEQSELNNYMANVFLHAPELKKVNEKRVKIPRASNETPDEVWDQRLATETDILDRIAGTSLSGRNG